MRFRFMSLILLVILAPVAEARDHGRRDRDDHHRHRPSESHRSRARWEACDRWERRHRCEGDWGHRQSRHHGWERESWIRVPAPTFHVRIQLP
ncbi:MAG: hypothetical protein HYZ13_11570 [Acidobacteria bacterium]|nr:hypothetical protein [Acidobacteriota bacterium]